MIRRIAYILAFALAAALLLTGQAMAQSACSPPAGTKALLQAQQGFDDHRPVVCGEHDCSGQYVDAAGFLRTCRVVEPVRCMPRPGWERWGGPHGDLCTSRPPGSSTSVMQRLLLTDDGRARLLLDEHGPSRGMQLWRCVGGAWRLEDARCAVQARPPAPAKPKPKPPGGDAKVGPVPRR